MNRGIIAAILTRIRSVLSSGWRSYALRYEQNLRTAASVFCAVRMADTSSGERTSSGTSTEAKLVTCSTVIASTGACSGSIPSWRARCRKNLSIPIR